MKGFFRKNGPGYIFLTPWFIGFFCLTIGPILISLYLAFTQYDIVNPPKWVGLENFMFMLRYDDRFLQSMKVTFSYVFLSVPCKLIVSLAVAMVLDKGIRAIGFYRALFYLPSILGGSIAVAILWRQLFNHDGIINTILSHMGITGPYWLNDPDYSLYTLVALSMWQFGSPMLIFLAGLRAIPKELYEAAQIDGAGRLRKIRHVSLPGILPIIITMLLLNLGRLMTVGFEKVFLLYNTATYETADVISTYVYRSGLIAQQYSFAAAVGLFNSVVTLVLLTMFNAIARRLSEYSLW